MADRRKLQGEVDRCLKKVSEGAEAFEDIWQKVQNATNVNQKEKYEGELKKEIKKLQRLREQIKTWAASSDIKDKKSLLENRKLIELQMERFRIVEKETKTKAYSKEGLGQANKIDPETKEFERCREWLNEAISKLNIQIDQMEMEVESLSVGNKKKKLDKDKAERTEELSDRIEKHRYHILQLEHILRMLDNETLEVDSVNAVKDDVEYYIDTCQEPDFLDDEGIYDDLDLENETEAEPHAKLSDEMEDEEFLQSSPGSSLNSGYSVIMASPASKSTSSSPRKNSKNSSSSTPSTSDLTNGVTTFTTSVNTTLSLTPSKRNLFSTTNHSSTNTTESTVINSNSAPMVNGLDHSLSDKLVKTSLPSSTEPLEVTPYASAAAVVTTSNTLSSIRAPSSPNKLLTSVEQNAVQVVRNHVESLKYPGFNGNNPHWKSNSSTVNTDMNSHPTNTITSTNEIGEALNSVTEPVMSTQESSTLPSILSAISRPPPSSSVSQIMQNSFQSVTSLTPKMEEQPPTDYNLKGNNSLFGGIPPSTLPSKPPSTDTQEVMLQPVHGVAPLGPVLLTQERLYQLKMLDAAFRHLPQRQDSEKMRPYISRSAVPIASYHHHQPPPTIDTLEFFQRLSTETLFFIFYYQEGTRAQYLAAKALKKQSWRFHTKYMMWFQRHEEPKRITDEFEEGTYIFFDYEKWSQRKRDGFMFEYRFLEDKELP